jgi:hypothetical protein
MLRSLSVVALSLLVGTALAGCGDDTPVATPTTPAPQISAFVSVGPTEARPGSAACALLVQAIEDATLMQPGVADAVVAASQSGDEDVAAEGRRLGAAYAAAISSRGTDGEPDAVAAVSAAGADMRALCVRAGLATAG